jgi:hypothetical protein
LNVNCRTRSVIPASLPDGMRVVEVVGVRQERADRADPRPVAHSVLLRYTAAAALARPLLIGGLTSLLGERGCQGRLQRAFGLDGISYSMAGIAGPALAAVVTEAAGAILGSGDGGGGGGRRVHCCGDAGRDLPISAASAGTSLAHAPS